MQKQSYWGKSMCKFRNTSKFLIRVKQNGAEEYEKWSLIGHCFLSGLLIGLLPSHDIKKSSGLFCLQGDQRQMMQFSPWFRQHPRCRSQWKITHGTRQNTRSMLPSHWKVLKIVKLTFSPLMNIWKWVESKFGSHVYVIVLTFVCLCYWTVFWGISPLYSVVYDDPVRTISVNIIY